MNTLTFLLLTFCTSIHTQTSKFYVIRQWKYLNFTWPDEDALKTATATGDYIPENNIVSGIKYFEDYYYLTLPRMKKGVPATLARIKAGPTRDTAPPLEPFPSWGMNQLGDCNNLQNVQNVEIDAKGQVWIIDGGRVQTLVEPVVKCGAKLVVYGLREGRVSTVFHFPEEVAARNGSYLYDLVVDDTDGGFAYITDNSAIDPGIIVFSVKENRAWKIRHSKTMTADPSARHFTANGVPISVPINIAGIALGPKIHTSNEKLIVNEDREVYFSPLSSLHLYSINTSSLRNPANFSDSSVTDLGLKSSQSVGMVMDNQGILYYTLLANNAIGRWDSHTPFQSGQKLIAQDSKYLEWPNSLTLETMGNLTVLMNRLNQFVYDKFDLNKYNFRLITAFVGGRSYVYDDNFNYDMNRDERMFHNESKTTPEPLPTPAPEPHYDDITSTMSNNVEIVKSASHKLASSLFTLILCFLLVRR
ncbi:yellow-1 precursor [Tribolium castaneum]|uniref:Protein yellow-like Protein n=1 Tax=Tribolium castaneum TaxID=7070 RepID=D6WYJ5_TRICA|nr:yellow-1 precursor [Tribolium castaneum]EFA07870.1 Protein yellow-like Protein [Tribolium castaneum]|eukprot:NP_001161783.1 yellow-1 precursor [Tribolium castaneum]